MTILFLFVALFALMFIGVPVAVSLGLAGSLTIMIFSQDSVRSLAIKLFETSEHYTLLDGIRAVAKAENPELRLMVSEGCHLWRENVEALAEADAAMFLRKRKSA